MRSSIIYVLPSFATMANQHNHQTHLINSIALSFELMCPQHLAFNYFILN